MTEGAGDPWATPLVYGEAMHTHSKPKLNPQMSGGDRQGQKIMPRHMGRATKLPMMRTKLGTPRWAKMRFYA